MSFERVAIDVALASMPMVALGAITWRLVWPKWKLYGKLLLHPCVYAVLSVLFGHWSIAIAWLHQGLGLAGHIWFSRRHGLTWYAVEDTKQYIRLSQEAVGAVRDEERRRRSQ